MKSVFEAVAEATPEERNSFFSNSRAIIAASGMCRSKPNSEQPVPGVRMRLSTTGEVEIYAPFPEETHAYAQALISAAEYGK